MPSSLKPITTGFPLKLTVVRETLAIGTLDIENLLYMVNDPMKVEQDAAKDAKAGHEPDEYAKLRAMVQRMIGTAASPKAKNIGSYADYIAAGLRGDLEHSWSVPPITLWCPRPLEIQDDGSAFFPIRDGLITIDGETQITAMHRIKKNPAAFDLQDFDFDSAVIAFEVYHGISPLAARQIFHDRNLKGAPVDKSLAMSMDMRDFGTSVTQTLVDSTAVTLDDVETPLSKLILTGKRQVSPSAPEWFTLSGLRTLVVTTILGKTGIHAASGDVEPSDIPGEPDAQTVKRETVELLAEFMRTNADLFNAKTAIIAPAVLAGLGALLHRETSWTKEPFPDGQTAESLLKDVQWKREAAYWGGIAAKVNSKNVVSWAGGARDSGHKVYDALNDPTSVAGQQVRGLVPNQATA
ncbi:DNA sulfur modification protein DndB [Streptomyces sp. BF23-18]|uniref:DNA sulfur modification protein DndB n=1 Tax=Streptomyces sp. BF23-18 TaxID=3240282 RepID=UPI0034E5D348